MAQLVSNVMTTPPVVLDAGASASAAAQAMRERDVARDPSSALADISAAAGNQ